ncbi:hypothetical protein [Pontiella agarivorans]|uniref:DUF4124 domain-containing protein n=1 Tax=Pontiella agarivorans TaxID=3038953 RepID=A0ABU5MZ18_9BACT|nr:hypothetical protein [Pontiella agarivorans]MDZ8119454.1 hypothetical protein [Pontiella agarivorans]
MKNLFIVLMLLCGVAGAGQLQLQDGTVFRNVAIISARPDHMLIVHDGGGSQIYFKDLTADSLSAAQWEKVKTELQRYEAQQARLAEAEARRSAQREKGLIQFEGTWMSPQEKEELLHRRAEQRLQLEKQRIQLARERAALEREKIDTARARYLLGEESHRRTTISYGYSTSCRGDFFYRSMKSAPVKSPHRRNRIIRTEKNNPYICTDTAAFYNRTPLNR